MALITGWWLYDVLLLLSAALAAIYAYFRHTYQHWRKRGFPMPLEPSFPYGNFQGVNSARPMDQILADIYARTPDEKVVGTFMFSRPMLVVRDLELAKNILVKDFSSFHDRGFVVDTEKDPLAGHLFLMAGQEWRNLRIKMTPTFTSGKMKMMFLTLIDVGKNLQNELEKKTDAEETEMKDILARYTIDVISSVAFGIETNSLKNPDAEFRKISNELSKPTIKQVIVNLLLLVSPKLAKCLPISLIPQHINDFFINIVRETMEYREKNNAHRNDFMQLLLQLKTLGYVQDADNPQAELDQSTQQKFTIEQAAAQAFLFLFAGSETSSATMQFALYELALDPQLQKSVQEEVDAIMAKHGGEITYEGLMLMELLDRIVSETLRKYPAAAFLLRECNKEYIIPGTDLKLLPKDSIVIPTLGYQKDPEYYPEPQKFDPDRFLPENIDSRPQYSYLPFGEGPRSCIGNRFGLMQTKAGLAVMLSHFAFTPTKNTPIPLVFDPRSGILSVKGGIYLKVSKRN